MTLQATLPTARGNLEAYQQGHRRRSFLVAIRLDACA